MQKEKVAVLLLNLGGPNSLSSVKTFLFNLFYDKRIITLPNPLRWLIAKIISSNRNKIAQEVYAKIGGKSPLLDETNAQASTLKMYLESIDHGREFLVLTCMRHFTPTIQDILPQIEAWKPDQVILLPLYPQYSTTTTLSSIEESLKYLGKYNVKKLCCYFDDPNFISAHVNLIKKQKINYDNTKILFSAHGLPKKIIALGDPYQWQVEQSVLKIVQQLPSNLEYCITYQSKVGPLEWIGPSTESIVAEVAALGKNIVIVPIAFVSEHVETLVELDMEYKSIAQKHNVEYIRICTLRTNKLFMECLGTNVQKLLDNTIMNTPKCLGNFSQCLCRLM